MQDKIMKNEKLNMNNKEIGEKRERERDNSEVLDSIYKHFSNFLWPNSAVRG